MNNSVQDQLSKQVIPLYFEGIKKGAGESSSEHKIFLGNGFIIGTMGKSILVLTARHIFEKLNEYINKIDRPYKRTPFGLPEDSYDKNKINDIKQHEIMGYISTGNSLYGEVRCSMDIMFKAPEDQSDMAVINMRIYHNTYQHLDALKLNLNGPSVGETVHIHAFNKVTTNKISSVLFNKKTNEEYVYLTNKTISRFSKGQVTKKISAGAHIVRGTAFEIDIATDGGNSGGLIYQIDNENRVIACGLISMSDASHSNSNEGGKYTIASILGTAMALPTDIGSEPYIYEDLSEKFSLERIFEFIILNVIEVVDSAWIANIENKRRVGFVKEKGKIIKINIDLTE